MSFSYKSYRELKTYLGQLDAVLELTEIAVRDFRLGAMRSDSAEKFIQAASDVHGVRVHFAAFPDLGTRLAQNYIAIVYQSAEQFFHDFRREHIELFGRPWTGDDSKKGKLDVTLANVVPPGHDWTRAEKACRAAFDYYVKLRNFVTHPHSRTRKRSSAPLSREKLTPEQRAYDEVAPHKRALSRLYNVKDVPHHLDEVTFDDFILFSRVTKNIAYQLSTLARPSDDILASAVDLKRFRRFQADPQRMHNAIETDLRTRFGLDADAAKRARCRLLE